MEKCEEAVAAEITSAAAATESSAVRGAAACAASPQSGSMAARQWLALAGLTCSAFVFNTSEFMPIGLLSSIAGGFGLTEAQAGMMTSIYAWAVMALSLPLIPCGDVIQALRRQPGELLQQVGAYIRTVDEFYYDVSTKEADV